MYSMVYMVYMSVSEYLLENTHPAIGNLSFQLIKQ